MAINYTFTTFSQFASAKYPDLAELPNKFWLVGYDAENYRELRFDVATTLNPIITSISSSYTTIINLSSDIETSFDRLSSDMKATFDELSSNIVPKDVKYTNTTPMPTDFTPSDGIVRFTKNTTFNSVNFADIITQLLYPTINASLTIAGYSKLVETGTTSTHNVTATLTEGTTIKPNTTRAYNFDGIGWKTSSISNKLTTASNTLTITPTDQIKTTYTISVTQDNQTKATNTFSIESAYPIYAATVAENANATKRTLISKNTQFIVTLNAEAANTYYTFDIPPDWNDITKIEFLNPVSKQYELWKNWKDEFKTSSKTYNNIEYKRYSRTGKAEGEIIGSNTFKLTF